jgi:hypothetical protein
MNMTLAILIVLAVTGLVSIIAYEIRATYAKRRLFQAQIAAAQSKWQQYREWCDSRVCLGGCGKKASERARDANGVCIEPWITEECCMDCWKAGRSSGRSADAPFKVGFNLRGE